MKFSDFYELSSLKGQGVTTERKVGKISQKKVGKIVNIENDKIHVRFEHDERDTIYTIKHLKNKVLTLNDPDTELAMLFHFRKEELMSSDSSLINVKVKDKADKHRQIILEQWRLMTESAMQVSSRRQSANNLFIAVVTILISGVLFSEGIFGSNRQFQLGASVLVSILGIVICIVWYVQMKHYGELNDIKYSAVREIEKYLPVQYFNAEDIYFYDNYNKRKSFSGSESKIPIIFIAFFIVIPIITAVWLYGFKSSNTEASRCCNYKMSMTETETETVVNSE